MKTLYITSTFIDSYQCSQYESNLKYGWGKIRGN